MVNVGSIPTIPNHNGIVERCKLYKVVTTPTAPLLILK